MLSVAHTFSPTTNEYLKKNASNGGNEKRNLPYTKDLVCKEYVDKSYGIEALQGVDNHVFSKFCFLYTLET